MGLKNSQESIQYTESIAENPIVTMTCQSQIDFFHNLLQIEYYSWGKYGLNEIEKSQNEYDATS